uniref:Cytochrome c oxidase subunit 3 n=1 Tax=Lepidodermella squamata TaxID=1194616 RepID=A0A0F6Q2W1_9BILA|nr:cytochrome c oxidase subunit 3 [Lepidodermella squamata]AKD00052.1 cytochrome c oxidase subunit 3 [Lepidodermella squamata]
MQRVPFHLVEFSPWPLTASLGALFITAGTASWMHGFRPTLVLVGLLVVILTSVVWWRDVIREGMFQGFHTAKVATGLRQGMILFILSEVCFFGAFFWGFFHSAMGPAVELGSTWPPVGVVGLDTFSVPLLNTVVLLSSGVSVTWAHHSLLAQDKSGVVWGLVVTVILGAYFTYLQVNEYLSAFFTISDGVYGSCFYVATGFHGLHVLIGSTFLLVCLVRAIYDGFSDSHHVGLESAAWYWHFVDVVWLFLFTFIYWWAGTGA